jgi:hypothetical protein
MYIVVIVGLTIGDHLVKIPPKWMGAFCLIGIAIVHGVTAARS